MGFRKGIHYPHPPRGPARRPYTVSPEARRQRIRNLGRWRIRSDRESQIIKRLIWQTQFEGPRMSQRDLARQLSVWPSYVSKVQSQARLGLDVLAGGHRVALDDLAAARRFTERVREQEPALLAPRPQPSGDSGVATPDDIQREAQELIRQAHKQNPGARPRTMQEWQELQRRVGRRVLYSVPVR